MVQLVLSSDSTDSATPVYSTSPSSEYSIRPVHSALTICEPSISVVLPGTRGFSGLLTARVKVPPAAASVPCSSPPPSSLPPQADSTIAPAMPAPMSAALRFPNFTCDASLVPHERGDDQVDRCPARGRTSGALSTEHDVPGLLSPGTTGRP